MKVELKIPPVGESITEARVSNILKATGSIVKIDEEILELETDKVNQVVYAPQAGSVMLNVKVGDVVTIGQVIGFIDTEAQAPAVPTAPAQEKALPPPAKAQEVVKPPPAPPAQEAGARKMAPEFLAGLNKITASIEAPAQQKPQAQAPADAKVIRKRMSGLRRIIAQRLVEVKNTTAMLTTFHEVDMTAIIDIRTREKENFQKKYNVRLGFMSFFVKAVAKALQTMPQVNVQIDKEEILQFQTYDIGVAVSTEKGLMVPVIKGCDKLSFAAIESQLETFSKKARDGTISVDDLRGGSFTITNGGVFGSLLSTPILNPPQSAILGMHNIVKRPVAIDDQVVIRPMMYLALSYDHRVIDGKEAVLFLVNIKQTLESPDHFFLDL